jgi:hypothetical protein
MRRVLSLRLKLLWSDLATRSSRMEMKTLLPSKRYEISNAPMVCLSRLR